MITINSNKGLYSVNFSKSLSDSLQRIYSDDQDFFFLVDQKILDLYGDVIFRIIENKNNVISVIANENNKSYENVGSIINNFIELGIKKRNQLVVIGGGVTQDIGCFIASILFRGIDWVYIPTTLLSQCDSCIGSKSSINTKKYKNQIGTFYPPQKIFISTDVLSTLTEDDIRSGLGEAFKLHLLSSEDDFVVLANELTNSMHDSSFSEIINRCLNIKKRYIEADEFDKGIRNILNYGHTFGHAYESATNYLIPHGIAVTLGVVSATFVSEKIGWVDKEHYDRIKVLLKKYYTPYQNHIKEINPDIILNMMKKDKKNSNEKISFILTKGFGKMEKNDTLDLLFVKNVLSELINSFD